MLAIFFLYYNFCAAAMQAELRITSRPLKRLPALFHENVPKIEWAGDFSSPFWVL
jgi:hypothetical protein